MKETNKQEYSNQTLLLILLIINTFIFLFLSINTFYTRDIYHEIENKKIIYIEDIDTIDSIQTSQIDIKLLELNTENFFKVCKYYNIKCPDVVYAQAQLESGHFKSEIFKSHNNFLGLYNSKIHDYYKFEHWTDCLKGYRDLLQYKYKGEDDNIEYLQFLTNLPYATDIYYIPKIQVLMLENENKNDIYLAFEPPTENYIYI